MSMLASDFGLSTVLPRLKGVLEGDLEGEQGQEGKVEGVDLV